jgi:hypothetical protein
MTGLRVDRRDRTLSEMTAGRPGVAPPVIRVADHSNVLDFEKDLMTTTLKKVDAPVRSGDPPRQPERQRRRDVEVRRVAVVQPGRSHFKLRSVGASLAATRS